MTAEYYEPEDVELDEGDERALDLFMGSRAPQTLADIIMQKIQQHTESAEARAPGEDGAAHLREGEQLMPELPPKVIEVYQGVGRLLSTYRSGKLPKAFKIIPQLTNWEEILYVTGRLSNLALTLTLTLTLALTPTLTLTLTPTLIR